MQLWAGQEVVDLGRGSGRREAAPGKSGLLVRGEGERVIALEPW